MPINYFETSFEARERRSQIENLYHGETVDLVAVVTTDGVPKSLDGYTATGVYQPTSMHGSEDFYELSADIVDNRIIVHWAQGSDFGEDSYMVWVLVTKEGDAAYPITWRLDMAYSPNFPLSDVVPIPKTIDFSKYELLNAPWLELSAVGDLPYLPLSGGTVNGNLSVDGNFRSSTISIRTPAINIGIGASGEGTAVGYNAKADSFGTAVGVVADASSVGEGAGTAIGMASAAKYNGAVAVGYETTANSTDAFAIGHAASATGANAIAVGAYSIANAMNAIQLGGLATTPGAFIHQENTVPHSLRVMDKMVLSGDNLTLDPERIPYLSSYETKADATVEHQAIVDGLSAYAKKEEVQAVDDKLSDYAEKEELTAYAQLSDVPVLPDDLVHEDELSDYAQLSDIPELPEDLVHEDELSVYAQLSDLENIDVPEISACLSSAEFDEIEELPNDGSASLSSIIAKIDEVIRALKRVPSTRKTRVVYTDDSEAELDIQGTLAAADIPNIASVKELYIGSEVTAVAPSAFNGKSNLSTLTIGENVSSIGDSAFYQTGLRSIHVPGNVKTIGGNAFRGINYADEIILDEGILSIGEWQFNNTGNNGNLSSIVIPDSVTDLGASAFQGQIKAKSVHIGNGVTDIRKDMFRDSSTLTSITFGNALSSISGSDVFRLCNATITFPESITYLSPNSLMTARSAIFVFEGKTMAEVSAMQNFRWGSNSGKLSCTDGTL